MDQWINDPAMDQWEIHGNPFLICLVGGLEHEFYFPISIGLLIIPIDIGLLIIPIDELHHFSGRGGPGPPSSKKMRGACPPGMAGS